MGDAPLVFVVGLQKSGTTLLLKLLISTSAFKNPVRFEGKELWGDDPPVAPAAYPTGPLYQRDNARAGHELDASDASDELVAYFRKELGNAGSRKRALVLKNPFNSGRVPWLRALFPEAYIVAVVRRPLPNVYSLMKKHTPNPHLIQEAAEGWWGVKPAGWRDLVQDDKLVQSAHQWEAINAKLWADRSMVDRFVPYHDLCADPTGVVGDIAQATVGRVPTMDFPEIVAMEDEYRDGGHLESANRALRRTKSFDVSNAERASDMLPPLTIEQQETVMQICGKTSSMIGLDEV